MPTALFRAARRLKAALIVLLLALFALPALCAQPARAAEPLSQPEGLYWDGTTARWDAVENAGSYRITLYLEGSSLTAQTTVSVPSCDCARYFPSLANQAGLSAGTQAYYRFQIIAVPGNLDLYGDSSPSVYSDPYVYEVPQVTQLAAPENLRWDGMTARWDAAPNAGSYRVWVSLEGSSLTAQTTVTGTSCDCSRFIPSLAAQAGLSDGDTAYYRFRVLSVSGDPARYSDSGYSAYSAQLSYTVPVRTKLPAPANLRWDGMTACWNPVGHAGSYRIRVYLTGTDHDAQTTVTGNEYDASGFLRSLANRSGLTEGGLIWFGFRVTAVSEDTQLYLDSDPSRLSLLLPCLLGYGDAIVRPVPLMESVLYLPPDVTEIRTEAFAGSSFEAVIVPEGCTRIEDGAFAGCESLLYVHLPQSLTELSDTAFSGSGNVHLDYRTDVELGSP